MDFFNAKDFYSIAYCGCIWGKTKISSKILAIGNSCLYFHRNWIQILISLYIFSFQSFVVDIEISRLIFLVFRFLFFLFIIIIIIIIINVIRRFSVKRRNQLNFSK